MKQFLAVAALNEAVKKHCDTRRDVKIYTEGFKAVQHEAMEFSVMCDGELYQLEKLHEELRQAGFPNPSSMEEAVLYAYLLWGEKAMEHMEGAYSFIIRKGDSLFCAKDPLGLRPIYYLIKDNCIWISCRIQPLLDASDTPAVLNREGLLELFAFGPSISENQTLYKDVHALPMGSLLRISAGKLEIKTYYKLSAHPHTDTLQETITKVHDLMSASIHAQASGAQASFLSGGLDSSLITSVAAKKNPQWRTYSLDYEGNKENFKGNMYQVSLDASFIQDMCEFCQCEHTPLMLSQQELCDLLEDAMLAREAPGMADVDSSLLWLCRKVAEKEQIILSGECSDEIFGGYPWFYRDELKDLDTFPWLRSTKERISLLHPDLQRLPYEDYIAKRYAESIQDIEYLSLIHILLFCHIPLVDCGLFLFQCRYIDIIPCDKHPLRFQIWCAQQQGTVTHQIVIILYVQYDICFFICNFLCKIIIAVGIYIFQPPARLFADAFQKIICHTLYFPIAVIILQRSEPVLYQHLQRRMLVDIGFFPAV